MDTNLLAPSAIASNAGFALGTAAGYFLHRPDSSFIFSVMSHGVQVGFNKKF